ncbi:MAG: hypothetical protein RML12_03060 [Xanthomonadales bacterium]|nr:hypothetical protein [Xanthomonadales bacterium]
MDAERRRFGPVEALAGLLLLALALLLAAAAQVRLRWLAEDALARTLATAWLVSRVEEQRARPYGEPPPPAAPALESLVAEAGLRGARYAARAALRLCPTDPCPALADFPSLEWPPPAGLEDRPQWTEIVFRLDIELPSGRRERLLATLRRGPLDHRARDSAAVARAEGGRSQ